MDGLLVLIPVNALDRAKTRLTTLLSPAEREALAVATLWTVVDAVREAGARPVILTADHRVASAVPGCEILRESPSAQGLNGQLEWAIAELQAPELLILHADLPLAASSALTAFTAAAPPAPSVTAVQSPDGGTNAMLLRPPGRFPLAYGRDSFEAHRVAAASARVQFAEIQSPDLSLDLDTPADLAALLATPAGRESRAGRLLAELKLPTREGWPK